jgi:hypothetical protein
MNEGTFAKAHKRVASTSVKGRTTCWSVGEGSLERHLRKPARILLRSIWSSSKGFSGTGFTSSGLMRACNSEPINLPEDR